MLNNERLPVRSTLGTDFRKSTTGEAYTDFVFSQHYSLSQSPVAKIAVHMDFYAI
jgi:hypothetical protein